MGPELSFPILLVHFSAGHLLGSLSCTLTTCSILAFLMTMQGKGKSPPLLTAALKVSSETEQPTCQALQANAFVSLWPCSHTCSSSKLDNLCLRPEEPPLPHSPPITAVHTPPSPPTEESCPPAAATYKNLEEDKASCFLLNVISGSGEAKEKVPFTGSQKGHLRLIFGA